MWTWTRKPAVPSPDEACSFCKRTRADVRVLVAGDTASICDACAAFSVGQLDYPNDELAQPGMRVLRASLKEVLARMGPDVPHRVSGPVLGAATALATSMAERHNLSIEAMRLRNGPAALLLLDVPGATPTMVLNAASFWIGQGDAATAAERVRAIDITTLPVVDQAHRHLNLASALLSCGGEEAEIEALLVAAEAALDEAAGDPYATAWRVCVHNSRGDLALRRGDAAGALQHFQAALAGGASDDPATHRRVGDAMHAMHDEDGARQAWTSALAAAHPDTPLAAQLRARLGS